MRNSTMQALVLVTGLMLGAAVPALAQKDVTMRFSDATNEAETEVKVQVENEDGGVIVHVPAKIPPKAKATEKRDLIAAALKKIYGDKNVQNDGADGLKLTLVWGRKGTKVRFVPGTTGEDKDKVITAAAVGGHTDFAGHFEPFDRNRQPAVFTAGIVTDVGELTARISAQELNFQTDGPIICQALFQRLAPRAPQYGAQINYAGDRLEVYFDPAYTIQQGGVVFGTTSPSAGCLGGLRYLPPGQPGDMNCDGRVDFGDINAFVIALTDREAYERQYPDCNYLNGDIDGDGAVTFGDINGFIDLIGG